MNTMHPLQKIFADAISNWRSIMVKASINSIYIAISASVVLPLLQVFSQGQGDVKAAAEGLLTSIGVNLLANQIQKWRDEAADETKIISTVASWKPEDPIRQELDTILAKLDAFSIAANRLPEEDRDWFVKTLKSELVSQGNLQRFSVSFGDNAIVVTGDAQNIGALITGTTVIVRDSFHSFYKHAAIDLPEDDAREIFERYMQFVVDSHQYLSFRGLGVADKIPLRLPLLSMFVPLKARIGIPEGEQSILGGDAKARPEFLVDLVSKHRGLIILGDPGSGKTTFLKHLTIQYAHGLRTDSRLPILVSLVSYADALANTPMLGLDRFIANHFEERSIKLPLSMIQEVLKLGAALVMLDGLDEVLDIKLRETVVRRVIDFFNTHKRIGNRFVITSRIIGYREIRISAVDFQECTIVPFDEDDIANFIDNWSRAIEQAVSGESTAAQFIATRESKELNEVVKRNRSVYQLATNPLLLTILALMKRQGVSLPERRAQLYAKYVDTLLSSWNRARGLDRSLVHDIDVRAITNILAPLALWMHTIAAEQRVVKKDALVQQLEKLYRERGAPDAEKAAEKFLLDVRDYAGLLAELGLGRYGFIHPTFREYLAAVALAKKGQERVDATVAELQRHIEQASWLEVTLLTVGYLGLVQEREEAASSVVNGLVETPGSNQPIAIVVAGAAVADVWPEGVTHECRERTAQAVKTVLESGSTKARATLRARAGNVLARMTDVRLGVVPRDKTDFQFMEFCYVPAGPFWMGYDDASAPLFRKHLNQTITYDYWIARFPITWAQWQCLMSREAVALSSDRLSNHPVVGLTWAEASIFCEALDELLRDTLPSGYSIYLPSEAEWEKAARGGTSTPRSPIIQTPTNGYKVLQHVIEIPNPHPTRIYSWGNNYSLELANTSETLIKSTNTVGGFSAGASIYGVEELCGNTWEWTRSLYSSRTEKATTYTFPYPYDPQDGREYLGVDAIGPRVVRGGYFGVSQEYARCSSRYRSGPSTRFASVGFRVAITKLPTGAKASVG